MSTGGAPCTQKSGCWGHVNGTGYWRWPLILDLLADLSLGQSNLRRSGAPEGMTSRDHCFQTAGGAGLEWDKGDLASVFSRNLFLQKYHPCCTSRKSPRFPSKLFYCILSRSPGHPIGTKARGKRHKRQHRAVQSYLERQRYWSGLLIPSSGGSSGLRDRTLTSAGGFFTN